MKTLLAMPWVGEFGHELFGWQAYLRKLSKQYDHIVIASRSGHEYLYEDFYSEFIPFDPKGIATDGHRLRDLNFPFNVNFFGMKKGDKIKAIGHYNSDESEFIRFGQTLGIKNVISLHARSTKKLETGYRNWPRTKWEYLVQLIREEYGDEFQIISIGTKEAAHFIEGTLDHRDQDLKTLACTLYDSVVCIGPSSGPMHFASLCGCPHVVWTGKDTVAIMNNRLRYEKVWNPLKTPVTVIDEEGWQPQPETVFRNIRKYLK
jgi:hypothetical protein